MSKQPKIKSGKQHIRLWFEFYKLCLDEPELEKDLIKSKAYYANWGDVVGVPFDTWWKGHKSLFTDSRVKEVNRITCDGNILHIAIPLNLPATQSIKAVKELVEARQTELLYQSGIDPTNLKSKAVGSGKYELTAGVEIRGKALYETQLMFKIWKELNKPSINTAFCMEVVHRLENRPRSNWIPYLLQVQPVMDRNGQLKYEEGQLRQVRRHIRRGEQICISVSRGKFPGNSRLR
jgi:hypothetical protein